MVRVSDLFALQEIDSAIDALDRSLTDIRSQQIGDESLAEERSRIDALELTARAAAAAQREAEVAVEDAKARVTPVEEKLYSGRVTSAKELQDLQMDMESLQRHQRALEETLLQALGVAEQTRGEAAAASRAQAEAEAAWQAEQARLTGEAAALEQQLAALRERRAQALRPIDSDSLRTYEQLRKTRAGRAVARVQRGACLGCRISLPSTIFQRARNGMAIVKCSNCERILYVG